MNVYACLTLNYSLEENKKSVKSSTIFNTFYPYMRSELEIMMWNVLDHLHKSWHLISSEGKRKSTNKVLDKTPLTNVWDYII
ncbi:CLUMA_CG007491, isoform A [Clunio marinus]|uniref:CLUMA_CG007491, isoform A n=1 Tax=Clunio marinus TaxID=568069 RepID=A0A1J1I111_9DIPT|nr:CLUMA_CG007491, isoform A [Clunio marinus]